MYYVLYTTATWTLQDPVEFRLLGVHVADVTQLTVADGDESMLRVVAWIGG